MPASLNDEVLRQVAEHAHTRAVMSVKLTLTLAWQLEISGVEHALEPQLFALLEGIEQGGHLNFAAGVAGVSYRHAWGLLRAWEGRLRQPLVELQRGRGARLAPAGRALLDARSEAANTTRDGLLRAAEAASQRVAAVVGDAQAPVRIGSSSSEQITALGAALGARGWPISVDLLGSEGALRRYQRGDFDIAGFHVPLGPLGHSVGQALLGLLDDTRDQVLLLELRVLGLMSRPERPVASLDALIDSGVRFINRQAGAGTRLVFDGLLGLAGIAPGRISGYRDEEYTHSAVAAMVASGGADCGLGTAASAARFGLGFVPLAQERFYLVLRRSAPRALAHAVREFAAAAVNAAARPPAGAEREPGLALLKRVHGAL